MTAQHAEVLIYEGQRLSMCTEPLSDFFALGGKSPGFAEVSTALWRGYVGTWEIRDSRLYLVEIQGRLLSGEEASLVSIFPGFPDRVFAHWFTGAIRAPRGRMLNYVHAGFASTFEEDLILDIERGVLREVHVRRNGTAPEGSPEGYVVALETILRHG